MVLELVEEIVKILVAKPLGKTSAKLTYSQRARGRVEWDMDKCDLCEDCMRVCPSSAVEVKPDEKIIVYKPYLCIYCHRCVEACMPGAIKGLNEPAEPISEKKDTIYKGK